MYIPSHYLPSQSTQERLRFTECWGNIHYTCIFPPGTEPDPSLVKEIRTFCPEFVPILQTREYRISPGNTELVRYHVIGLWLPVPDPEREHDRLYGLDLPPDFPFSGGAIYQQRAWSHWPQELQKKGYPDLPLAFDRSLVEWMKKTHYEWVRSPGQIKQKELEKLAAAEEATNKEIAFMDEETRYALREDRHIIKSALDEGRIQPEPVSKPLTLSVPSKIILTDGAN